VIKTEVSLSIGLKQCKYKHSLTFRVWRYVVIATKPVNGEQIRLIVQLECTPTIPLTYIQVRAVTWECGEGQTNRRP